MFKLLLTEENDSVLKAVISINIKRRLNIDRKFTIIRSKRERFEATSDLTRNLYSLKLSSHLDAVNGDCEAVEVPCAFESIGCKHGKVSSYICYSRGDLNGQRHR